MPAKRLWLPLLLSVTALIFLTAYLLSGKMDYPDYYQSLRWQTGDDTAWKNPGYNDSNWKKNVPLIASGNWWLRVPLKTFFRPRPGVPGAVLISIHGSYELYWDGIFIGENGIRGYNINTENPGARINYFLVPDSLMNDSVHLVALRISTFHDPGRTIYPSFGTGSYKTISRLELKGALFYHVLAGIFLVIFLYYSFLYFVSQRYLPYLLFASLCGCFCGMILMEYMRSWYQYPYPFHFRRLYSIALLAILSGNLLSVFLLVRFKIRYKILLLTLLNILLGIVWFLRSGIDDKTKAVSVIAFTFALLVCLAAVIKKRQGSNEAFYGVLACLGCHINYDSMLYIGFSVLVIFMLFSLSRQMRTQLKSTQELQLRSNRLETELLKMNIRPHFLMNSLTSLMEWVERSPSKSIEFIHALAEEFDLLNTVSSRQLIPLTEEIKLCSSHLAIMSFRKDINYQVESSGVSESETIPPAVLLTLIENGLTHNSIDSSNATFRISYKENESNKIIKVFSPGIVSGNLDKKGTGLSYVEARLEESYPSRWSIQSGALANGWETVITVTAN